jgi:hypothetical protein
LSQTGFIEISSLFAAVIYVELSFISVVTGS